MGYTKYIGDRYYADTAGDLPTNVMDGALGVAEDTLQIYTKKAGSWQLSLSSIDGAGSANKLAIWSDTNTLTYDTLLHWDTTNNRLGINNLSPSYTLDVTGTARISSALHLTSISAGTDNTVLILNSSGQVLTDEIDSRVWGSSLVDGSGTANRATYWSDANTVAASSIVQLNDNGLAINNSPVATEPLRSYNNGAGQGTNDIELTARFGSTTHGVVPTVRWTAENTAGTLQYADVGLDPDEQWFGIKYGTSSGNLLNEAAPAFKIDVNGLVTVGNFTSTGNVTFSGVGADVDNTVLILNSSGEVKTDEIDSRVWGSTLVDGSGSNGRVAFWTGTDTLSNDNTLYWDERNNRLGNCKFYTKKKFRC
jgi:hypothetical protein